VVSVVPGKRTAANTARLVEDFKERTGGRPMNLITSDEYAPYKTAILKAYGKEVTPPQTGKPGRPRGSYHVPPPELNYATVHKTRKKGRVVNIDFRVVFGTVAAVTAALASSLVSNKINTAFVERQNGTDRNRNGRKVRKTYCFSKDWNVHEAVTYFTMYTYNFCSPGANTPCPDVRWPLGPSFSRHGRRTGRPCLVSPRMASLPSRATRIGHKGILATLGYPIGFLTRAPDYKVAGLGFTCC